MRRVRSYSAGSNDEAYVPPIKDHAEGVEKEGEIFVAQKSSEKDFLSPELGRGGNAGRRRRRLSGSYLCK